MQRGAPRYNRDSFGNSQNLLNSESRERKTSSTTRFLPQSTGTYFPKRHTLELDFDHSISTHYCSGLSSSAICPRVSINEKSQVGKRVAFIVDPSLTTKSSRMEPSSLDTPSQLPIDKETVINSLIIKNCSDLEPSFSHMSMEDSKVSATRSFESRQYKRSEQIDVSESQEENNVFLLGTLYRKGVPELVSTQNKKRRIEDSVTSQQASVGLGSNLQEEIWPWPWLNPEMRAKNVYRSPQGQITFTKQCLLLICPVPTLEHTLSMYLQSIQPCVRADQFDAIQDIVKEFAEGEGKAYHETLANSSCTLGNKSWVGQFIPNYNHCYSRQEAMLLNTAIIAPFVNDLWPDNPGTQLTRAANLIELAVEFWQLIRNEQLLPLTDAEGHVACMHQFAKLFSTTKIPGNPCDANISYFKTRSESYNTCRHIIVIYKGHLFTFHVVNTQFAPLSTEEIKRQLKRIKDATDAGSIESGAGIGVLTSLERNVWSQIRVDLMELSENNRACLQEIEQAMFVVSLDHHQVTSPDRLVHEAVFADGCNRWYDKGLSFYIYDNGLVTVNINSALLDGSVVAFLLHYIHLRIMEDAERWDDDIVLLMSRKSSATILNTSRGLDQVLTKIRSRMTMSDTIIVEARERDTREDEATRTLIFDLDAHLEVELERAKVSFANLCASFSSATCKYENFERNIFENKQINTDAFANLVMQLTFFRMYFRAASIGTKVSLMRFHNMRYEYMRTSTSEALHWCKVMLDPESTLEMKKETFWKAEKKYKALLRENSSGRGCENHLAALHVIAEDLNKKTPTLFQEKSLCLSSGDQRFEIYSESLGVACPSGAVVLPTNSSGYGVGYFVVSTKVIFNVMSLVNDKSTSAKLFASTLLYTMKTLHYFIRLL